MRVICEELGGSQIALGRVRVMVLNFFPPLDPCLQQGGDGGMKHHSAVGSWVTAHALA
jgi:hypothetical protein